MLYSGRYGGLLHSANYWKKLPKKAAKVRSTFNLTISLFFSLSLSFYLYLSRNDKKEDNKITRNLFFSFLHAQSKEIHNN